MSREALPLGKALPRKFFLRPPSVVGRDLLGKILVCRSFEGKPGESRNRATGVGETVGGIIVETEAYLAADDPASHSHRGKTARNASMFAEAGTAYIYLIYGMHHCFNVVTSAPGVGEAVLIRAVEPLFGIELMRKRRNKQKLTELCRGPGRLAEAFGFSRALDGASLLSGPIFLHEPARGERRSFRVGTSARIGISVAVDLELRYFIEGSPFVSR